MAGHLPAQAEIDTALPGDEDEENKEKDDSLF
jgi:hypothetical protein